MKTIRKPSPARSLGTGPPRTPIHRKKQRSRSVSSARSNVSGRLTALIQEKTMDSFAISPLPNRNSILSDNTEIGEPRRKSWWKKLGENSRDVIELLEENNIVEPNNIIDELDIEVLSQEQKNYTMDLPESSDCESINSIVIPQRKLFTQKENQPHKKFGEIIGARETLTKLHKPSTNSNDQTASIATRELFQNKPRSKPIFPTALLNISPNKTTADKTKELTTVEPKAQVRNIFGNRAQKRKNIFTNFIVSESEDEIPEIQPKVFGFQKKMDARRRGSSSSRGMREPSPTSSITTDIEMDDWKMLPSSTMVETQLEIMMAEGTSPKRVRLSKLTEIESENGSNATKQSNKSVTSKEAEKTRKSKTFTKEKAPEPDIQDVDEDILEPNKETLDKTRKSKTFTKEKAPQSDSMTTRNKSRASMEDNEETPDQNRSSKDKDKSRKSKTFIKERAADLSSDTKIVEQNISQYSIKTRSRTKTNSPNNSQVIVEESYTENTDITLTNKNKSKSIAVSPKGKTIVTEKTPLIPSQENDEDELNFTLIYDSEEQHEKMIEQTVHNKSKTSKNMTQLNNSVNVNKSNKTDSNKVIEESAELESTQNKSKCSMKVKNTSQAKDRSTEEKIEVNYEQVDLPNDALNNSNSKNEEIAMKVGNVSEPQNESEVQKSLEHEGENNETSEIHESQNASDNELQQSIEAQNQSERDNVSQELDDVDGNDESQNLSEEQQNDSQKQDNSIEIENEEKDKDNESQEEPQNESEEQNESLEMENEVDEEQNEGLEQDESQEAENEEDDEQNTSQEAEDTEEQNESEVEDQEIEAIADSDNDNEEHNSSQDTANDDTDEHNQEEITQDDEETGQDNEEIENSNVSHDTTGRNRKKNESPEVILHDSTKHLDSFAIQGRNTSVRKTELIKSMHIRPSLALVRESNDFSDGTRDSSAEGSGWDSHRTTRKTLRQTYGRDFTPRKSLRALVMEKSAKRQTQHNDIASVTAKFPIANSTELPEVSNQFEDDVNDENQEPNEISFRTRQTTLETYLQEIKKKNAESRRRLEEAVESSLNAPPKYNLFKVPARPIARRTTKSTNTKQTKSTLLFGQLPPEVLEDFKYKPPKRFKPSRASWITKRLYKHLESKLEVKYDYKARIRAEKLVENIYHFAKDLRRRDIASSDAVDVLKREMARLDIVKTHFDFYDFIRQFMPREVRIKVIPDIVNNMSLPKSGVFSDIL